MSTTLVVFYSMTGNVKRVALKAAELLEADVEELVDLSKWSGFDGFFNRAGRAAVKGTTKLGPTKYNPQDYDKIVIVSPLWKATIAPAVRTYLKNNQASIHEIYLIVQGGFSNSSGSKKEVESMGINLKGVLGLLDQGQNINTENSPLGNNLPKLERFVADLYE